MNTKNLLKPPSPQLKAMDESFRAARRSPLQDPTSPQQQLRRREPATTVTFSPLAWLKLLMFLHAGDTEIGGFGISSKERPLYIEEFVTVKQTVSSVTVGFDDAAVADYFDQCIDRGLAPAQFARIWIHTHPGQSAQPSSVDEETFARVFGGCDWAIMLIVSRTHETYARLSFSAGPGGALLLGVNIDWAAWPQMLLDHGPQLSDMNEAWMDEYGGNIFPEVPKFSFCDDQPTVMSSLYRPRLDELWQEDEIYAHQSQMFMDEQFADDYAFAVREER